MDTDTHTEKTVWKHTEYRQPCLWSDASPSQGTPKIMGKYQKLEDPGEDSPLEMSERTAPCHHLDFGHLVSRIVRQYISAVSSHLVWGTLLQLPLETNLVVHSASIPHSLTTPRFSFLPLTTYHIGRDLLQCQVKTLVSLAGQHLPFPHLWITGLRGGCIS